jgi:uncharacterized protein YecE (DUF72 family)
VARPLLPRRSRAKRELEYAGQHLTGIEINGTYYGSQKPETFANWAASVPDGFRFSVKASRFTTNRKILAEGAGSIEKFLTQGLTRLGDRLGPIHWQFMATKKFDRDDFAGFLDLLPDTQDGVPLRHAIEVRDESFRDPAFIDMVRERNMAIVYADSDEFPCIDEQTADFTYARLQRSEDDIETGYDARRSTAGRSRPATGRRATATSISSSYRARRSATPPQRRR